MFEISRACNSVGFKNYQLNDEARTYHRIYDWTNEVLFDSLAEGYLIQGNKELAIINYKISLKLDPENKNALNQLAWLVK